ncbi:MAG: isopentenyl-diphosphate Delta-isomerase [Anaerovoracaceae bacterium]|nr:isopentenyl-diphosphate Delta-isomerase [Anaerovoracaceae bacterium]
MTEVLLVNDKDKITGEGEKLDVHRKGLLHRAFSVFLADEEDRLLIQKRAEGKYHSGGVWSNSCCSHQYSGETLFEAAARCIRDELGISIVLTDENAHEAGVFRYYADLGEMKEHEIDHVIVCRISSDVSFDLNPDEVSEVRWMKREEIDRELAGGAAYSSWFERAYVEAVKFLDMAR